MQPKRFEILEGLPTYGPMYIPISDNGEPFYYEGLVIRFYNSNGSDWVANFKPGWSNCNFVFDYVNTNRIIVIANGQGYIMNPNSETPIDTFGIGFKEVLKTSDDKIILTDDTSICIVNENGIVWQSKRISWDGIKELKLEDNIVTGLAYDPMDSINEWKSFSINLETKEIVGGSYRF